jgi:hypothetical protein
MRFLAYTIFSIISTFASSWIIFSIFGGCNNRGNFFSLYFVFEFFYHTVCVERMELIFVPMFPLSGCCIINPIFKCRIIYQKNVFFIFVGSLIILIPLYVVYLTSAILRKLYAVYLHPKKTTVTLKTIFHKIRGSEIKVFFLCSRVFNLLRKMAPKC